MIGTRVVRTVTSSCNASHGLCPGTEARAVSPHQAWPDPDGFVRCRTTRRVVCASPESPSELLADLVQVGWVIGQRSAPCGRADRQRDELDPAQRHTKPPPGSPMPLRVAPSPKPATYQCNAGVLTTCDLPVTVCVRRVLCPVFLTSADLRSLDLPTQPADLGPVASQRPCTRRCPASKPSS